MERNMNSNKNTCINNSTKYFDHSAAAGKLVLTSLLALVLVCTGASTAWSAAYSASVEMVKGKNAFVYKGDESNKRKIKTGSFVSAGETIMTGARTNVVIKLAEDGSKINIGHNTRFKIENPEAKPNWKSTFRLISGWVRSMVRKSNPKSAKVKQKIYTPSGTIGVRGTEFSVEHNEKSGESFVYTNEGMVAVGPAGAYDFELTQEVPAGESLVVTADGKFVSPAKNVINRHKQRANTFNGGIKLALAKPAAMNNIAAEVNKNAKVSPDEMLLNAVETNNAAKAKRALKMRANPNLVLDDQETLLIRAARNDQLHVAALLIDAGANVNAKNKLNQTALMLAARTGNLKFLHILLQKRGIKLKAKDKNGATALDYAINAKTKSNSNQQAIQLLKDKMGIK